MALYIPARRRRRRVIAASLAGLCAGLVIGLLAGRSSAPSFDDRVKSVQTDARGTAAGLRVLALHDQAAALSTRAPGDAGADLVLQRTRRDLVALFERAPWVRRSDRARLLAALDALRAEPDRTFPRFGAAADALATQIEDTFAAP
jgi:hypothetical protein